MLRDTVTRGVETEERKRGKKSEEDIKEASSFNN